MGNKSKKRRDHPPKKVLPCTYCDMTFHNKTHLDKHIHRSHLNTESHYCPECTEVKDNIHDFLYHMRSEHKIGHLCRICKQSFPRQKMRAIHEKEIHSYIHGITPKPVETQPTAPVQPSSSQAAPIPQIVAAPTPQINPAMAMVPPVIPPVAVPTIPVPPMYNPYMPQMVANMNPQLGVTAQLPINSMIPQPMVIEPPKQMMVQPSNPTTIVQPKSAAYATQQNSYKDPAMKAFEVAQKITAQIANEQRQNDYYSSRPQSKPTLPPPSFSPPSFAPPTVSSSSSRNEEHRPSRFSSDYKREDYERERETYKRRHEDEDDYAQKKILMDYVQHRSKEDDYHRHDRRDYREEPERSYSYSHASRSYATDSHHRDKESPSLYNDREQHYSYAQPSSKSSYSQGSSSRHNPY